MDFCRIEIRTQYISPGHEQDANIDGGITRPLSVKLTGLGYKRDHSKETQKRKLPFWTYKDNPRKPVLNKKVTCQTSQAKDTHWFNLMKMSGSAVERGARKGGKGKGMKVPVRRSG